MLSVIKVFIHVCLPQTRNDELKHHPMLCPLASLRQEDSQYDYVMAHETLATLIALGYCIVPPEEEHAGLSYQELPEENFRQNNGYLPRPLNLESVQLDSSLFSLVEKLSENGHNIWAASRIKQVSVV